MKPAPPVTRMRTGGGYRGRSGAAPRSRNRAGATERGAEPRGRVRADPQPRPRRCWRGCRAPAAADPSPAADRQRWQARWTLPIIVAAVLPMFTAADVNSWVEVIVGVGAWLIFLVDMIVQRRIVPDYLRRPIGWFDLGILVLTFPFYLIPGVAGGTGFLVMARLARVMRVLVATAGLRRFAARLGKVAVVAAAVVVAGAAAPTARSTRSTSCSRPTATRSGGPSSPSRPSATATSTRSRRRVASWPWGSCSRASRCSASWRARWPRCSACR